MKKHNELASRLAAGTLFISICLSLLSCSAPQKPEAGGKALLPPYSESEFIRSKYSPGELLKLCQAHIENTKTTLNEIGSLPASERTLETTLLRFERVWADFSDVVAPLTFMAYVSPDAIIRKEGSACEEAVTQFGVQVSTREDLYAALKDQGGRNDAEKRLHSETIRTFERNGLKLPADKRVLLKQELEKIAKQESKFSENLNNDVTKVEMTREELQGVPDSVMALLERTADDKYIVSTKRAIYAQVMENAVSDPARKKLMLAYENRGGMDNVKLLEDTLLNRQRVAELMGYKTYADYKIEGRMAANSANVMKFLNNLKSKLLKRSKKDLEKLRAFKVEKKMPGSKRIEPWDVLYLTAQVKKRDYSLDDEVIREYFPSKEVVEAMFEIYSDLFGVRFEEVTGQKAWADQVKFFRIVELTDPEKIGKTVGYFYADFFPRDGKYGHAAAFTLIQGRTLDSGAYALPVSAIVSNFNPAVGDKPSLLNHDEVETLFHEFGHVVHQTLTRAPFASLSGSSVYRDFVEAPSQMLENWVWDKEMLGRISGHYKDRSRKLPDDLMGKLIAAQDFNRGYHYVRQLYFGFLDMKFHTTKGSLDTTNVLEDLYREIIGMEPIKGGHFQANFGHLMGGYDAGYYGYLWSEVYAADMFTRFSREGLLSQKTGLDYRRSILERGNMQEPMNLLVEFLGRNPNSSAFFKKLGI